MNLNFRRTRSLRRDVHSCRNPGFTLVEILVTITILIVLAGVTLNISSRMRKSGLVVKELAASRNLTSSLMLASQDLNGQIPYGNDMTISTFPIEDSGYRADQVTGPVAHRWPWRLAPYFGYKFEGTTVVGSELNFLLDKNSANNIYMISLLSSLAMNIYGVGGELENTVEGPTPGALRQMQQAVAPNKMIAFISARVENRESGGGILPGNYSVTTPLSPGGNWATKYNPSVPSSWGHVDMRHDNKAVVGYLDGSAGTLDKVQVRDMRHWSNDAALLDDPNYRPTTTSTGGGRGR